MIKTKSPNIHNYSTDIDSIVRIISETQFQINRIYLLDTFLLIFEINLNNNVKKIHHREIYSNLIVKKESQGKLIKLYNQILKTILNNTEMLFCIVHIFEILNLLGTCTHIFIFSSRRVSPTVNFPCDTNFCDESAEMNFPNTTFNEL